MPWREWAGIGAAAFALNGSPALAADLGPVAAPVSVTEVPPSFYIHVGPGGLILDEAASLRVAGQNLAGATIKVKSQLTVIVEAGYYLTPNIAVSFTGGLPPLAKIEASGILKGLGTVGKASYGPTTLTAQYHFMDLGPVQPYIGVGPAFMYVFDDKDGLMDKLSVRNTIGIAFQAGADLMLDKHWGVFVDVKKAVLRTQASGFLGGLPVKGDVRLDPLVVSSGVSYRF